LRSTVRTTASSRFAHNQNQLPIVLPCPLPAPHQHGDFLVATDERRKMPLSGAACSNDPAQYHRLRHAFQVMAAALLGDEQAGDRSGRAALGTASSPALFSGRGVTA
jgi:hypothetical protein